MDSLNDQKREVDAAIEDALRTYPLDPAPAGIMHAVMRRIEITKPLPRFRLHWLDYAISLFFAGMSGLVLVLTRSTLIPPSFVPILETRVIVLWQQFTIAIRPIDPVVFIGVMIIGSLLSLIPIWVFLRSRLSGFRMA